MNREISASTGVDASDESPDLEASIPFLISLSLNRYDIPELHISNSQILQMTVDSKEANNVNVGLIRYELTPILHQFQALVSWRRATFA
ncbi:hypothetical protein PSEUDO8BK_190019 [Pseudomonas sp. 8BK]|nr:hypothetical protein PSEUDO8BK_190019 [Pseudomonas sp. 8BK]